MSDLEKYTVYIVVDNTDSWMMPYAHLLFQEIKTKQHIVFLVHSYNSIVKSDITFLLSCEKIISEESLQRSKHNLVVHESKLPEGRGWSPLTWQILEGKNKIPITLFEAQASVDSGEIYGQDYMIFEGHELIDDMRKAQGISTINLCLKFLTNYPDITPQEQSGEPSFYAKRTPKDSELDVNKTIAEQFNLLRVVDNERYPAFFYFKGQRYNLKIEKSINHQDE